jgi:hypothetical protein
VGVVHIYMNRLACDLGGACVVSELLTVYDMVCVWCCM